MSLLSPRAVLARVARQVPAHCRQHIIVIGSLDVAAYRAIETPEGIRCARLEMLALSNLLRNPVIRPERMQTPVGPGPKRSNKDLGRVLAIARLAGREVVAQWPAAWAEALRGLEKPPAVRPRGPDDGWLSRRPGPTPAASPGPTPSSAFSTSTRRVASRRPPSLYAG